MFCWSTIAMLVVCFAYSNLADTSLDKSRELLMKHLLANYHPSSRPGRMNETVMVFVDIELQHFDYTERDGAFHLVGLMHVRWRDPKLVWHPRDFANMSHITISQRQIWVPDLEFYNNFPNKFIRMHRYGFVTVKNDGVVFWSDTVDVNMFCTTHMKNWPHDKHECQLNLGSWVFDGLEVDIMHVNPNASMSFRTIERQSMQYRVTQFVGSHKAKYYACCPQPYITMEYNITFERDSTYVVIFRIPAITVIMFTLFALSMEPQRTEKFWLNAISLLLICGNLIYFAFNSRNFSKDIPNIVEFFRTSLVLATISQLIAVFSMYATRSTLKPRLGTLILRVLNSPWTRRLVPIGPTKPPSENMTSDFNDEKLDDVSSLLAGNLPQNEWQRLATLLQRVVLLLFVCYFLILSTVCFV